jgi:hypothetical protein
MIWFFVIIITCIVLYYLETRKDNPKLYLKVIYMAIGLMCLLGAMQDPNYDPNFREGSIYTIKENVLASTTLERLQELRKASEEKDEYKGGLILLTFKSIKKGTKVEILETHFSKGIYKFRVVDDILTQPYWIGYDAFKHPN